MDWMDHNRNIIHATPTSKDPLTFTTSAALPRAVVPTLGFWVGLAAGEGVVLGVIEVEVDGGDDDDDDDGDEAVEFWTEKP